VGCCSSCTAPALELRRSLRQSLPLLSCNDVRSSYTVGFCFALAIGAAPVPANAGDAVVVVVPPDYSYLHNAGKAEMESAGRQLGAMLGSALQTKRPIVLVVEIKCDHYISITAGYADGSIKTVPMNNEPVDKTDLATAQAAIPILRAIDGGC
jgi:hypothetical protein